MFALIREFPLTVVIFVVYLFGFGLLMYGISIVRQLIKDLWFIRKYKIFYDVELKEKEMEKNFDRWLEEWKKLTYRHDSLAWDYRYTKKRFQQAKKDFYHWLFLTFLLVVLILILNK